MAIYTICGSQRTGSRTLEFTLNLSDLFPDIQFKHLSIKSFPLFDVNIEDNNEPKMIKEFIKEIDQAEAVIIITPEYLHNIPASLKSAFEWLTKSGALASKPILPIVFTPSKLRGEKALQSLLFSLNALDCKVVASLQLFHTDFKFNDQSVTANPEIVDLIKEAILLLK